MKHNHIKLFMLSDFWNFQLERRPWSDWGEWCTDEEGTRQASDLAVWLVRNCSVMVSSKLDPHLHHSTGGGQALPGTVSWVKGARPSMGLPLDRSLERKYKDQIWGKCVDATLLRGISWLQWVLGRWLFAKIGNRKVRRLMLINEQDSTLPLLSLGVPKCRRAGKEG